MNEPTTAPASTGSGNQSRSAKKLGQIGLKNVMEIL